MLAGFAPSEELKLHVSFRAPTTTEQSEVRSGEIRASLRDLGLDDDVELVD